MLFFTPVFALQTLVAFLLFSSPSYAGPSICVRGSCSGDTAPKNCQVPTLSQPAPKHRGNPEVDPGSEGALCTDAQAFPPSKVTTRGNGICVYVNGGLEKSIGINQKTIQFTLAAGTYALKWLLNNPRIPVYFVLWTAPSNAHNFISGVIDQYGGTFVSDGVSKYFLVMFDQLMDPLVDQRAEIWAQAV